MKITPLDFDKAEKDLRAYCKKQGVDLDSLAKSAGRHFTDEAIAKRKKMTKAERNAESKAWIKACVDYEMSVDDWGRPLSPLQEPLAKVVFPRKKRKTMNKIEKVIADIEKEIEHKVSNGRITSAQMDFIHGQENVLNRIRLTTTRSQKNKQK